ncbi:helix-turn-helix transcriptional regulator [Nocardioides sp.]|uniref:helix-turn-helix domain-containing protein n=1 Tax=Nocardioides sp. TaxID=35761 RepID=UPI002CF31F49|nr:helix-turn-helix transcriptional regulator [Nocardioides sp.]HSX66974.1 helix-turn-helix transcriptional regulator [Nocardioides sp.]
MLSKDSEPSLENFATLVGHRLQAARVAKGLSQERVAHLAGIAGFTYQKFEKGESRPGTPMNPRLTTLIALCQVLDLQIEDLLAGPWPDLRYRA